MPILRIALDIPLPTLFDYTGEAVVGQRVVVPFGTRRLVGVVMEVAATSTFDPARIKPIAAALQDRKYSEELQNGDEDIKLKMLQEAAGFYKVARNLHTTESFNPNESHKRYQGVLECIDSLKASDFSANPVAKVEEIERQISKKYGDRGVLSLTTKLLWLKVKEPIVIYDSQARKALGSKDGKYPEYYAAWQSKFKRHQTQIAEVCAKLPELHLYAANRTPKAEIEAVVNQNWFHERVFDIYLWNEGN